MFNDTVNGTIRQSPGTGEIMLTAGYHTIDFMSYNDTTGGGYQLLYAGPDSTSKACPTRWAG